MVDVENVAGGDIKQDGQLRIRSFVPIWIQILILLTASVSYLLQRGTPEDQAKANALTMMAVMVIVGLYVIWFVCRGPARSGVKRFVGWGILAALVLFFFCD